METTLQIVGNAEIVAFLSMEGSLPDTNDMGYFAININGVDSPVYPSNFGSQGNYGSIGLVFHSGTLAPGTYTIKGRWYTDSSFINGRSITLVAVAMENEFGVHFENKYVEVASDDTTSPALEDIDGLNSTLSLAGTSHIFGVLAASARSEGVTSEITEALDIAGGATETKRTVGGAHNIGSICVVGRSAKRKAGSKIIKGQHAIENGTGTSEPVSLFGMELGSAERYEIPSAFVSVSEDTTTSTDLEDISGSEHTITLQETAHIFSIFSMDIGCSMSADISVAIRINGVDYETIRRTVKSSSDVGSVFVVARTDTKLPPGTYPVSARWATTRGEATIAGNSLNMGTLGLENVEAGSPSESPSESPSLSTSASISPSPSSSESASESPSPSPGEEPLLFDEVEVIKLCNKNTHFIEWDVDPDGGSVDDYNFEVYWSTDPASGFLVVRDSNDDPVVIDGAVGPLQLEHDLFQYDFNKTYHYKVKAIWKGPTSDVIWSDSIRIESTFNGIHDTMRYAEYMLNSHYIGDPCKIIKRKRTGARCTECWSPERYQRTKTHCDTCHGTGFLKGYYQPIDAQVAFDSDPKKSDSQKEFENVYDTKRARISNYPIVSPKDLIVNCNDGKRYVIQHVETTKLPNLSTGSASFSKRNYIVSQLLTLEELNTDDNEYRIDMNDIPPIVDP